MEPDSRNGSYQIESVISGEEDLEKLHYRPVEVDWEATHRDLQFARDAIGDLLVVEETRKNYWRYGLTRVLIHMRGLEQMMLDMIENPSLMHRLMEFLRDDYMREIDYLEKEKAVSLNNTPDNVTGSGGLSPTKDLPGPDYDGVPRTRHSICWGESQECVGVGPAMFDEFVLEYQLPLMARFGLVDYGCCEPLHDKVDLLIRRIPRLRWISVSPWADRERCANAIGDRYVFVYKPNPSRICVPVPDWEQAERDIRETLTIARGCPVHICMKDTHTFCHEPDRTTRWCRLAVSVAEEMA
jgi:hypothetical protein